jgi:hypothetical protein
LQTTRIAATRRNPTGTTIAAINVEVETSELDAVEFVVPVVTLEDVLGEELPGVEPELEVVTAACEFEEEPSVDTEEVVVVSPPGLIASIAIDRFCANHSRIDNFSSSLLSSSINVYVKDAFRK